MEWLDLTLSTPAANLALDEALLDDCESQAARECLRFWEPEHPFVVVGYGQQIAREAFAQHCRDDHVPILRRCTGGGTVFQAPGCLNYSLVLSLSLRPELVSVTRTNSYVMHALRDALAPLLPQRITVEGHTDLAMQRLKFSGNAQRRRRQTILFHGTFLLSQFPLTTVGRYLRSPSLAPDYREGRRHEHFLTRLPIGAETIKATLRARWSAEEVARGDWPEGEVTRLVATRYGLDEWIGRL